MSNEPPAPARGRPRTLTRERIAEAGMQIGLPALTFTGLASALGVSHVALYKHVPNLEELKRLVAAEIFERWQMPPLPQEGAEGGGADGADGADGEKGESGKGSGDLEAYLLAFTHSLRELARAYPGLAPWLIRRAAATPAMTARIDEHHAQVARAFGISKEDARQTLAMVAFHCIAVADTVCATPEAPHASAQENSADRAEIEADFERGMRALIAGALLRLGRTAAPPD